MRRIYILFKGSDSYQYIEMANDEFADQIFTDLYNARINKDKDLYLITGGNTGYMRFIDLREINDCYITPRGTK